MEASYPKRQVLVEISWCRRRGSKTPGSLLLAAPPALLDCPMNDFQLERRKLMRSQTLTFARTAGLQSGGNHSGALGRHSVIRRQMIKMLIRSSDSPFRYYGKSAASNTFYAIKEKQVTPLHFASPQQPSRCRSQAAIMENA
ncbi:uncharacterized protein V6R79_018206 [Siganus canaliculatus]